jgi:DNA polymerase-3 subunit delta'
MEIPWLKPVVDAWQSSRSQGRMPHALMLTGGAGTGKRAAAAWLAKSRLGLAVPGLPEYPVVVPEHADLRWVTCPEDKYSIGIDQVRELVGQLSLTSYEGGGKVAVIEPADAMTTSAANSLLKTLEEPPGDALLILIVDRPGRLPPTIVSRCQRLYVHVPGEAEGLAWLNAIQPGSDWGRALRDAGLAPLAAIEGLSRADETDAMATEFRAVAEGSAAPLGVAAKWAKLEPDFVLGWLSRQVQMCIRRTADGRATGVSAIVGDSVLERIDRRKLFCYLDIINRLRGQPAGSFNVQLTLECLLIDWSTRLESLTGTE